MQDTGIQQIVIEEQVNEALETDNLALQNMSGSKYVAVRQFLPDADIMHTAQAMHC